MASRVKKQQQNKAKQPSDRQFSLKGIPLICGPCYGSAYLQTTSSVHSNFAPMDSSLWQTRNFTTTECWRFFRKENEFYTFILDDMNIKELEMLLVESAHELVQNHPPGYLPKISRPALPGSSGQRIHLEEGSSENQSHCRVATVM